MTRKLIFLWLCCGFALSGVLGCGGGSGSDSGDDDTSGCTPACASNETCAAGQCVPIADCSNCDGCCLDGTQCLPGNTPSACGTGGDACQECTGGTGCDVDTGACVVTDCDASNCDGCCTPNGQCLGFDEQSFSVCGNAGDACAACDVSAVSCTQGTCVSDQPCLDFCTDGCCTDSGQCIPFAEQSAEQCGGESGPEACTVCAPGLGCSTGACTGDTLWNVVVVSAVISPDEDGAEWDSTVFTNPLPDPYAGIALSGDTFLDGFTQTIDNTVTPTWNHSFGNYLESDLLNQGLTVSVRDSDGGGIFETIGACTVSITIDDITNGSVTQAQCGHASNIVIRFDLP
jgi:hypothetical protein